MNADHFEILVEEPSMEAFLSRFLVHLLGNRATFQIHTHQGKSDLLSKLGAKLRAYSKWLPRNYRIIILVDRDDDDCLKLKSSIDSLAHAAGLTVPNSGTNPHWHAATRIVVEELEAWYFGDWTAVRAAYPTVKETVPAMAAYRNCDAIAGGTWEAIERILQSAGYFKEGLRKVELASIVGYHFNADRCRSASFIAFQKIINAALPLEVAD